MSALELKTCPRCNSSFNCNADAIEQCQCNSVKLNDNERGYINDHFDDCLCVNCIKEMKEEFYHKDFNRKLRDLLGSDH